MTDKLTYEITKILEGRVRVVVSINKEVELGTLYFEKAKNSFQRKPISMDGWRCVDAKIEGLYEHGGEHITPKNIVAECQKLIKMEGY